MLQEKVQIVYDNFKSSKLVWEAIEAARPAKEAVEKACEELRVILDSGKLVSADEEVKTAIVSVHNIFEMASKGLEDPSVAPLFSTE